MSRKNNNWMSNVKNMNERANNNMPWLSRNVANGMRSEHKKVPNLTAKNVPNTPNMNWNNNWNNKSSNRNTKNNRNRKNKTNKNNNNNRKNKTIKNYRN